jgi:phage tail tape-measure protein
MTDVKKDHSIGSAGGAVGGAVAGAGIGGAVGGPVGAAVGAVAGGIGGAKAGDSIAEAVNPTEYTGYWRDRYLSQPYYSKDYTWNDYEPAYKLGYDSYSSYRGRDFDDIDSELERKWEATKGASRLAWSDAKYAVKDGWHYVERALPGDADGDGR